MNVSNLLPNVTRMLASFKLGGKRDPKLSKLDFGILQVAMMVAALDGEILPGEYAVFTELAKKCRGYSASNARACLDEGLRKGGYLMAIARVGEYTAKQRVAAFVEAALAAMPAGFVDGDLADLRRAFVLWVSMGVSDGTFSDIERQALEAFEDQLAQVMLAHAMVEEQRWVALSPTYRFDGGKSARTRKISLLEPDFFDRAETLVRALSVVSKREKAEAALATFVVGE